MAANEEDTILNVFDYRVNIMQELGLGGFGTVYKGLDKDNNPIAVKKMSTVTSEDQRKASTEAVRYHFMKKKINHSHVVKVHDVKYMHRAMWIVMEYCDLLDLHSFWRKFYEMLKPVEMKVKLMKQIADGVAFLHSKNVVHRDIKPGNILVKLTRERHAAVKLGDFGLSKILDLENVTSGMSSNVGTLSFKAPEFWDKKPSEKIRYHRNVDVYAAGLTFAAMLQAKMDQNLAPKAEGSLQATEATMPIRLVAFSRNASGHLDVIVVGLRRSDSILHTSVKHLILNMTSVSPRRRIPAHEVVKRLNLMVSIRYCKSFKTECHDHW